MSREVRMVPADWQHPRYPDDYHRDHLRGRYIPLHDGGFAESDASWTEGFNLWRSGLVKSYGDEPLEAVDPAKHGPRFSEWEGERPSPDDYMPEWPTEQRTHYMMYETTSEGTPKSPAFATPEELARWLADTGASAFAGMTATYDQWLRMARGGWAPSAVMTNGIMVSGVEALAAVGPDTQPGTSNASEPKVVAPQEGEGR